jgi:hypothetical protein
MASSFSVWWGRQPRGGRGAGSNAELIAHVVAVTTGDLGLLGESAVLRAAALL